MSLLLTGSTLFLFPILILCTFVFICHKLFPKFIPPSIMSNYITPAASRLTWALDFLLQFSLLPNLQKIDWRENGRGDGRPGLGVRLYEAEPGSEEVVECAVCLCKIEEGEEVRELRCSHMFHRECLDGWVGRRNATCPVCRGCIVSSSMVDEAGHEVLVIFNFSSFCPRSRSRSTWWLR